MGVKLEKPIEAFDAWILKVQDILNYKITTALQFLGEECVNTIRDRSAEESWFDRTGNLRSSIGYSVVNKGRAEITSAFDTVLNGSLGSSKGKQYVNSLAHLYADTYALIVVAGMEYAEEVEAMQGKDVLASTQTHAEERIKSLITAALNAAEVEINKLRM